MAERGQEHSDKRPGVEWLADSPFLQELALRLARDLRMTRFLAGAAGVALVLLVAGLFLVAKWGVELARRNEVVEREHATPVNVAVRMPIQLEMVLSGLPMPKEPLPDQMRGPCRGVRGVEFRGGCWFMYAKAEPKDPCNANLYDAPPEATGIYKDMCYVPIQKPTEPRSLEK